MLKLEHKKVYRFIYNSCVCVCVKPLSQWGKIPLTPARSGFSLKCDCTSAGHSPWSIKSVVDTGTYGLRVNINIGPDYGGQYTTHFRCNSMTCIQNSSGSVQIVKSFKGSVSCFQKLFTR